MMRFGIVFPNADEYVDADLVARVAASAEKNGFNSLLTWDHYGTRSRNETFDSWTLLSYLAARTHRIRLGTCVTPIPLRPPAILAKMVSSLDRLSGGRVILGVGAGWHRPEFEGFSAWDDDAKRVERTEEGLRLMLRLWTERSVDFAGKYYVAKGAVVEPKPLQKPHPELWFGTTGRRMLKLAAEYGTGWIPTMISAGEYSRFGSQLRKLVRPSAKFTFAYDLFDPFKTRKEYVDSIEAFGREGCQHYFMNWKYKPKEMTRRLSWFAREVIPSFR